MKLEKISEHIWIYPYQDEFDRPVLGYIKGKGLSIAVDAGHSEKHVEEFYSALKEEGLPLPDYTVITHWHWDHSFGMHAVNGKTIAFARTDRTLRKIASQMDDDYQQSMMDNDVYIAREYDGGRRMIVVPADVVFNEQLMIIAGDLHIQIFHVPSPHTNDSVFIYVEEDEVLFTGDALCERYPDGYFDVRQAEKLYRLMDRIDFKYEVSGHWDVSTKEETMNDFRNHIDQMKEGS